MTLYSFDAESKNSQSHQLEAMLLEELKCLELFFTPVSPARESVEYRSIQAKFSQWMSSREDTSYLPLEMKMSKSNSSAFEKTSLSIVSLPALIADMFESTNSFHDREGQALSIDDLVKWFQYSVMERPPTYEVLDISPSGICLTSEQQPNFNHILSQVTTPQGILFILCSGAISKIWNDGCH